MDPLDAVRHAQGRINDGCLLCVPLLRQEADILLDFCRVHRLNPASLVGSMMRTKLFDVIMDETEVSRLWFEATNREDILEQLAEIEGGVSFPEVFTALPELVTPPQETELKKNSQQGRRTA